MPGFPLTSRRSLPPLLACGLLGALSLVGCGDDRASPDAGVPVVDAGQAVDAGPIADAGAADSGAPRDSGSVGDAGPVADDAGPMADSGPACRVGGCPDGSFCDLGPTCDFLGPGVCRVRPGPSCSREFAPVCGCDGETYSNRCLAEAQGMTVVRDGMCEARTRCDAEGYIDCGAGAYCRYSWIHCGIAGSDGSCFSQPDDCVGESGAVCGCDGTTYASECHAALAGVSVELPGPCE